MRAPTTLMLGIALIAGAGHGPGTTAWGAQEDTGVPLPTAKPGRPEKDGQPRKPPEAAARTPPGIGPSPNPGQAEDATPALSGTAPPFDLTAAKACEAELAKRGVTFKVLDPIKEQNGCGAERPLSLESIADGVVLEGGATARCEIALALDTWMQETVQPSAKLHLGTRVEAMGIGSHYDCRGRNGSTSGKLSEHAFANGIDILGFRLEDKRDIAVKAMDGSADPGRAFLAAVRASACAYFTTVLGPGTDSAHGEHLHFDLASRGSGYRMCQ